MFFFFAGVRTCSWSGWPFFVVIDRAQSPQRPERWRKMWFSRVVWYRHGNFPDLPNGHLLDSTSESDLSMEIPSNTVLIYIYIIYLFQMAIVRWPQGTSFPRHWNRGVSTAPRRKRRDLALANREKVSQVPYGSLERHGRHPGDRWPVYIFFGLPLVFELNTNMWT